MRKNKDILIHGKRYKDVSQYFEEQLLKLCDAIEYTGFNTVIDFTTMPYFHKEYGRPDDFLTHLLIKATTKFSTPDISSDIIFALSKLKHIDWHTFSPDPNNSKLMWLNFTIR